MSDQMKPVSSSVMVGNKGPIRWMPWDRECEDEYIVRLSLVASEYLVDRARDLCVRRGMSTAKVEHVVDHAIKKLGADHANMRSAMRVAAGVGCVFCESKASEVTTDHTSIGVCPMRLTGELRSLLAEWLIADGIELTRHMAVWNGALEVSRSAHVRSRVGREEADHLDLVLATQEPIWARKAMYEATKRAALVRSSLQATKERHEIERLSYENELLRAENEMINAKRDGSVIMMHHRYVEELQPKNDVGSLLADCIAVIERAVVEGNYSALLDLGDEARLGRDGKNLSYRFFVASTKAQVNHGAGQALSDDEVRDDFGGR